MPVSVAEMVPTFAGTTRKNGSADKAKTRRRDSPAAISFHGIATQAWYLFDTPIQLTQVVQLEREGDERDLRRPA